MMNSRISKVCLVEVMNERRNNLESGRIEFDIIYVGLNILSV